MRQDRNFRFALAVALAVILVIGANGCATWPWQSGDWYTGPADLRQPTKDALIYAEARTGLDIDLDDMSITVERLSPTAHLSGVALGPSPLSNRLVPGYFTGKLNGKKYRIALYDIYILPHECLHVVLYRHGVAGHPKQYRGLVSDWRD